MDGFILAAIKESEEIRGGGSSQRGLSASVEKVVFDRSGYIYASGRVRALAEGARSGGLQF